MCISASASYVVLGYPSNLTWGASVNGNTVASWSIPPPPGALFANWSYSSTITFSGYRGSDALTNFPVMVVLGTNTVFNFSPTQAAYRATGQDVRFSDSTLATELNYEKGSWNTNATSNSYFWVQVPLLTNGASIVAYWGRTNQTAPAYSTNGAAWTPYVAVWHLGEAATSAAGALKDSTVNTNNATGATITNSPPNFGVNALGLAGSGSSYITPVSVLNGGTISGCSNLTVSGWFKGLPAAAESGFIMAHNGTSSWGLMRCTTAGRIAYSWGAEVTNTIGFLGPVYDNWGWDYVGLVIDHTNATLYSYGLAQNVSTNYRNHTGASLNNNFYLGWNTKGGSRYFWGAMQEIRIATNSFSKSWMDAVYLNTGSNSIFQSYSVATP